MTILLLGAGGLQGKAALYDLSQSPGLPPIIAADSRPELVGTRLKKWKAKNSIEVVRFDANDHEQVVGLMERAEVVIDLLPSSFALPTAKLAIDVGVNLVNSGYIVDPAKIDRKSVV